ncbi:GGDEF domain-containing protein [Bosea sp. BH3]|uniref:GGDEF domain-containing protein n=1 Tax=Bosea sp. BH3 TaxID=2871701 RepID=UPI0021CAEE2B|nr:sensor domain-containing diguanylate cyclase [Bosea sp. BH3]MCU4178117.1 sensor domain-containing diguanylate cyclase [Bosea sp. BH3]
MTRPSFESIREQGRLEALQRYDVLDTPEEEGFDRIIRLVRHLMRVPMATVTFVDGHRQWFKARQGLEACEGERRHAFCDITIRQAATLIVPDTHLDSRLADNPLVTGAPHLRFYAGVPLITGDGHAIGTLCALDTVPHHPLPDEIAAMTDLAQVTMDQLELRQVALTDLMTGALSRRAFRDELARMLGLAKRHQHELSLIAFDLDHFKAVNDTHGHQAGDRVLAESVAACRRQLRQSDLIGRLGGEEFAVLLPLTGRQAALGVAEKLRQAIAALSFEGAGGGLFSVTASLGLAALDGDSTDPENLLRAADEALYAAKATGRDRCVASQLGTGSGGMAGKRVLKAGRIVFNAGQSVIDCTVRRLSERGASLAVTSTADVPSRFKLAIEADSFSRLCETTRKAGSEIEVAFA